jgi:hypothetical protein
VFDQNIADLNAKYTLLELDTFCDPDTQRSATAWCVVENPTVDDLMNLETYKNWHSDMMQAYRAQDWSRCLEGCENLTGKWNSELDSFYQILQQRVETLMQQPPALDWDHRIPRSLATEPQ